MLEYATTDVVRRFFELALEAERIDSQCLEEPVEPAFEAVLSHVLAHPESRVDLANAFVQVVSHPNLGPPELVQYCMHVLRWVEVRQRLSDWLDSDGSERVRHVLRKLLMSFDDDWYGADLYARFSRERDRPG